MAKKESKNPVTGKNESNLYGGQTAMMAARAKLKIKKRGFREKYKGTNPAGLRLSSSSVGTYKNKDGTITRTTRSTKYGLKEKVDKKGRVYQNVRETSTSDTSPPSKRRFSSKKAFPGGKKTEKNSYKRTGEKKKLKPIKGKK